ncbi:MAG: hypothetical protein MUC55_00105 [Burkholderiales bacterium]|jgi:hypothetical protein|nr:hypothetical protein [Burkholderiales bacterium]
MAAPYVPFALGALAGAVLATAAPSLSRNAQPALKDVIRTVLVLAHQIQVKAVEFVETLEDAYAEARSEAQAAVAAAPAVTAQRAAAPARRRTAARKTKAPARKPAKRVTRGAAAEASANA